MISIKVEIAIRFRPIWEEDMAWDYMTDIVERNRQVEQIAGVYPTELEDHSHIEPEFIDD